MSANDERNAEIIRRRKAGEWPRAIAKDMGLSHNVVIGVCNRAGLCDAGWGRTATRPARGEAHGSAKLTNAQVQAIRAECILGHRGFGCRALAKRYSVSSSTIRDIVNGVTWAA
jgi:transposase